MNPKATPEVIMVMETVIENLRLDIVGSQTESTINEPVELRLKDPFCSLEIRKKTSESFKKIISSGSIKSGVKPILDQEAFVERYDGRDRKVGLQEQDMRVDLIYKVKEGERWSFMVKGRL